MAVEDFAEQFDEYFRNSYQRGRVEYFFQGDSDKRIPRERGSTLLEILTNDLAIEDEAAAAIIHHLPEVSQRDIQQGVERLYSDTYKYERTLDVGAGERAD